VSEDDDRCVGLWSLQLVEVLRACQGICRTLAEEALLRIDGELPEDEKTIIADPAKDRQAWLIEERDRLMQLLDRLGDPL
jgi:hypothetical protein